MDRLSVECFADVDPSEALIIVAFHGTGAAAPIAAGYLQQTLDLPLVGHIRAPDMGAVVHVSEGIATSPVRIYGGDIICHLDHQCDRLFLVTSELPIAPEHADTLAKAILEWAAPANVVLCLDAVAREAEDETPDVFAIAATDTALGKLARSKAEPLGGGIIVGLTAAILGRARDHGVEAGAFLVEAAGDHPDGRAAAALITAIDPLVPQIAVDPGPLLEEALVLEAQMEKALREAEESQTKRPAHTFI